MIDNFEQISELLTFNSPDEFYFVQIIQRKKDNKDNHYLGTNNSSRLIKAYYISSIEKLNKYKPEMIALADLFNARVGINLNKRSFKRTAFDNLGDIVTRIRLEYFDSISTLYNTSCGQFNPESDKIWLLDFDYIPTNPDWYIDIKGFLYGLKPVTEDKVIAFIPSKNGVHVITKPFDSLSFKLQYPDIEIHKNNPVNLYIP